MFAPDSTYLFEFIPPLGAGSSKRSICASRFEVQPAAFEHAKMLMKIHGLNRVRIFRLEGDAKCIEIGAFPAL